MNIIIRALNFAIGILFIYVATNENLPLFETIMFFTGGFIIGVTLFIGGSKNDSKHKE